MVVNDRYWPDTERLQYAVGDTVTWRVINAATIVHQMHLHGFHFRIDAVGTPTSDSTIAADRRRLVVTDVMMPGSTLTMTRVPKRVGNWLFHGHFAAHMAPTLFNKRHLAATRRRRRLVGRMLDDGVTLRWPGYLDLPFGVRIMLAPTRARSACIP